jgi:hypothetical protein
VLFHAFLTSEEPYDLSSGVKDEFVGFAGIELASRSLSDLIEAETESVTNDTEAEKGHQLWAAEFEKRSAYFLTSKDGALDAVWLRKMPLMQSNIDCVNHLFIVRMIPFVVSFEKYTP